MASACPCREPPEFLVYADLLAILLVTPAACVIPAAPRASDSCVSGQGSRAAGTEEPRDQSGFRGVCVILPLPVERMLGWPQGHRVHFPEGTVLSPGNSGPQCPPPTPPLPFPKLLLVPRSPSVQMAHHLARRQPPPGTYAGDASLPYTRRHSACLPCASLPSAADPPRPGDTAPPLPSSWAPGLLGSCLSPSCRFRRSYRNVHWLFIHSTGICRVTHMYQGLC